MKFTTISADILDGINQSILLIDSNFAVVDANAAFCRHLNLPLDQIIGQSCYKLSHNAEVPCWQNSDSICPVKIAFETGKSCRVLHNHVVCGKLVVEEIVATPLEGSDYIIEEFLNISHLLGLVEGILPICSACKRIRDDKGKWHQVEEYVSDHSGAAFSHSCCPECLCKLYPEVAKKMAIKHLKP